MDRSGKIIKNFRAVYDNMSSEEQEDYLKRMGLKYEKVVPVGYTANNPYRVLQRTGIVRHNGRERVIVGRVAAGSAVAGRVAAGRVAAGRVAADRTVVGRVAADRTVVGRVVDNKFAVRDHSAPKGAGEHCGNVKVRLQKKVISGK